jgi:hypothetical protein
MGGGAGLLQQLKNSQNRILKGILCMLQCCFACLERFLKMLTKNAYVEVGRDTDGEREREIGRGAQTDSPSPLWQTAWFLCLLDRPTLTDCLAVCGRVCVCVCVCVCRGT